MLDTPFGRRNVFSRARCLMALLAVSMCLSLQANGQTSPQTRKLAPQVELPTAPVDIGVGRTNLECAGYFRLPPLYGLPQIVGGEQEQEKRVYATGDIVYIDAGSQQGIKEGQEFHVIRPRGWVERVYRKKKGNLGVFVQEIGQLRVIRVKDRVSVAQVSFACDPLLLGDLLTGLPDRVSPTARAEITIDRFTDPNNKPTGRLMMARDGREMVTVGDLVYVDIGAEDQAVAGDMLTIYRKVGTGNLGVIKNEELARRSDRGFGSEKYRGGTFSQEAQRSKDVKDEPGQYRHSPIKTTEIKKKRPEMPRKVVGEAMIINVQVRTATAIIMRTAQEVHTGDFVEIK
ncbi:MAG TPA: hypothetical protein VE135_05800 [Pyrinomonadaceae bacterium]|nr:hypothetical protein [Pyrinomonadaceae bacterium]